LTTGSGGESESVALAAGGRHEVVKLWCGPSGDVVLHLVLSSP